MKLPHFSVSYGKKLQPARDWGILLALLAVGLAASLAWNLWLFGQVVSGAVFGAAPQVQQSTFDQSSLDSLAQIFADRASELAKYKSGAHHFIDPSK